MVLDSGRTYPCTLQAKLPFPIGKVTVSGKIEMLGSDTFAISGTWKKHSLRLDHGRVENGIYSVKTTVKGAPAGAAFTIDSQGKIDGTGFAWKFSDVSFSGSVEL